MQNEPEKTLANYNEFLGQVMIDNPDRGTIEVYSVESRLAEYQEIVRSGVVLVHSSIDHILGKDNKLGVDDLVFPKVRFTDTDSRNPNSAGYYASGSNEIAIITGNIDDHPQSQKKVFIHEYIHYLSHNGRDDSEQISHNLPIAEHNNVGFRRHFGLDIRSGREDERTSDYFLALNEAVTEQLAIDILPGVHETYSDYRGLLNQIIDDGVVYRIGSQNKGGLFQPWSRDQVKNYIYRCFFKGDLSGFTQLLQTIYHEYDISEQQFGLMTHKDDLPSVIERGLIKTDPDSPPPSPTYIALMVQKRLDSKTAADYVTDIIDPAPNPDDGQGEQIYGTEYDRFIAEHNIATLSKEIIDDREIEVDSLGYVIYRNQEASEIFELVRGELDTLISMQRNGEVDVAYVTEHMDEVLFKRYAISMLSDGFRDFYIYKHTRLDRL